MAYDPYEINLDEFVDIMHPTEAIQKMNKTVSRKTRIRCKVFNINIDDHAEQYEALITECANGDKRLVKQETTFDKVGDYIVALHWEEDIKDGSQKST